MAPERNRGMGWPDHRLWSLFKRGLYGTCHHMSGQHLRRCLAEFSGLHNVRDLDAAEQMGRLAVGLNGRRLPGKILAGSASVPAPAVSNGAESNRSGNTLGHACAMSGLEHPRSGNRPLPIQLPRTPICSMSSKSPTLSAPWALGSVMPWNIRRAPSVASRLPTYGSVLTRRMPVSVNRSSWK